MLRLFSIYLFLYFVVLGSVQALAATGLDCGSCNCPDGWSVISNNCDSSCGGSCRCEKFGDSDVANCVRLGFDLITCFMLEPGIERKDGSCGEGDGTCTTVEECQYECPKGSAPCCQGGGCACCDAAQMKPTDRDRFKGFN
ncbi:MAG: hypothetical protein KDD64_11290 [Bdellovibrionales bacterium]|nr:hypothetical protein [Bdellovibrionales bacterium]